jgi:hypothetical protein
VIWSPVFIDCRGSPDIVVSYVVLLFAVRVLTWMPCGELLDQWCPVYDRGPWTEVGTFAAEAVCDAEGCALDVPYPPIGGMDWWRVEALDLAGNRSDVACE